MLQERLRRRTWQLSALRGQADRKAMAMHACNTVCSNLRCLKVAHPPKVKSHAPTWMKSSLASPVGCMMSTARCTCGSRMALLSMRISTVG